MIDTKPYIDRFLNPHTRDDLCRELGERIDAMTANRHKSTEEHITDVITLGAINRALLEASSRVALQRHLN